MWGPGRESSTRDLPCEGAGSSCKDWAVRQIHKGDFPDQPGLQSSKSVRLQHGTLSQEEKQKGRLQFKFTTEANTRAKNSVLGFLGEDRDTN